MRIYRILPVIAAGMLLSYAFAQDILTPALNTAFTTEWTNQPALCVRVLKYKGEGKDKYAFDQLSSGAPAQDQDLYKIGKDLPDDAFWKQMATAGAVPPPPIDCQADLSNLLNTHFALRRKPVGDAARDSNSSIFLGLYDLLVDIPNGGLPANAATIYRNCFSDSTNLFTMIKTKLRQTP
jgi:hypothetical protein